MPAPAVRIRIGGSLDNSLSTALRTAAQMTGQAEKAIQRQKKQTTSAAEAETRKQLQAEQHLAKAAESLQRQRSAALYRQHKQQEASAEHAAKAEQRARQRTEESARREIEKTFRTASRAIEQERRAQDRAQARARDRFATRTSHRATRFLMPEAPIGSIVASGLRGMVQGAGLDWSIQGMVGRNVAIEQAATDLSNSGYQAGAAGPNGQRVDPRALIAQSRQVSDKFGFDANEVLEGLVQYQKIAGDLDTGRQSLFQMAALAKATGTNLGDMAAATANVSNGLGDIPDKARIIDEVMRTIAGQGKLGAVEISDMATQMARIAAAAGNFGGDRAKNIATFGALAQIARAEGGAPSAAESARSMGGFAQTFKKAARDKEFTAATGKSAYTDETHQQLRDPMDLIKDALAATKGDQLKMNKIFMDVVGGRTVSGLQKAYVGAGGGDAGLKAVDDLFNRMREAQISQEQVAEDAKHSAATAQSKAARMQNSLDAITESVMKNVVPALDEAGPSLLRFAEAVGDAASWAAQNPWKAALGGVGAAITTAVVRASVESAFRASLERAVERLSSSGGGPAATLSKAGTLGNALTVATLGVTTLTVGYAVIDSLYAGAQKAQRDAVEKDIEATNAEQAVRKAIAAKDLPAAKAAQEEQIKLKEQAIQQQVDQRPGYWDWVLRKGLGDGLGNDTFRHQDESRERSIQEQTKELAASRALLARIAEAIEAQPPPGGGPVPGGRGQQ